MSGWRCLLSEIVVGDVLQDEYNPGHGCQNDNHSDCTGYEDFDQSEAGCGAECAMSTDFSPSSCSNKATIGMLPPPRVGIGSLPNVFSMALLAALKATESVGVTTGSPP